MVIRIEKEYPTEDGIKTTIIPNDLSDYINYLEEDMAKNDRLYGLISLALYGDYDVWKSLGGELFRDEILRNFYNEEVINNLKDSDEKSSV